MTIMKMRGVAALYYTSTRNDQIKISPKQALIQGISKEGGLFVCTDFPKVDLDALLKLDYYEKTIEILSLFFDDFSREELSQAVYEAYHNQFDHPRLTPVQTVSGYALLELFHGPTCAFKDMALRLLPRLISLVLKQTNQETTIITATSGDTGKAALSGFAQVDRTQIVVLYPKGLVSPTQEKQMVTQEGDNVHVWAIEGNFDDCQQLAKKALTQLSKVSSANSINIGRLVPQIVYYFDAYQQMVEQGLVQKGQCINVSVPTGNFGDILAGYYAKKLGCPIHQLLVASNANHVLSDFFATGTYDRRRAFVPTMSPSMDILVSSNLERLLYEICGPAKTKQYMEQLANEGLYQISQEELAKLQQTFKAQWLSEKECQATIKQVYEQTGYVLDPHTAVAYGAAQLLNDPVLVLATASPYKFEQAVLTSLGLTGSLSDINPDACPLAISSLEDKPVLHHDVYSIDQAYAQLEKLV